MFFSTELLTRRKGGFGLFWLAATLGSKGTSFKKLSRKEVLACNLVDACEKLAAPDEPLALRLSSNLLCGIARVYQQQFTIYSADVNVVHQTLKRAVTDIYKNALMNSNVDLPAATGAPGAGINLGVDPGLANAGWDADWDLGMDWSLAGILGTAKVDEEGSLQFGSGVDASFETPDVAHRAMFAQKPKASINLAEPQLMDYMLQDDPGFTLGDPIGDYGDGEGFLMGLSPELDAVINAASGGGSRAGSGNRWGQATGVSSSGAGGMEMDMGGNDDFFNFDAQDDYMVDGGLPGESAEERVAREHREAANRQEGGYDRRGSSLYGDQMDVGGFEFGNDGKPPGSASKRKLDANGDPQSPKSPKKAKGDVKKKAVVIDSVITLSDERFSTSRQNYVARMAEEKAAADKVKQDKLGRIRAMEIIFGVPDAYQAPELADFWRKTVGAAMTPYPGGKAAAEKAKAKSRSPKHRSDEGREFEYGVGQEAYYEYGEGGGEQYGEGEGGDMGGMGPMEFDVDVEQGRGASQGHLTGSQRPSPHPWNAVGGSDGTGGYGQLAIASSHTGEGRRGSARASLDTPIKDARRSRSASLLGSGTPLRRAGSLGFDVDQDIEGLLDVEDVQGSPSQAVEGSQIQIATLEKESFNFLAYAKRQVSMDTGELLFSDIVPIAATNRGTAAQALYHLLAVASKGLVKVNQDDAYGDIYITIA